MTETNYIADQLERAYRGRAWHGPALLEALAEIDAASAAARPLSATHSIWEIVKHLMVWHDVPLRRLQGERGASVVDLPATEDWPPVVEASPGAWRRTLDDLQAKQEALRDAVIAMSDDLLEVEVAGSEATARDLLYGVLQHNLYHTGQIALLRKQLTQREE